MYVYRHTHCMYVHACVVCICIRVSQWGVQFREGMRGENKGKRVFQWMYVLLSATHTHRWGGNTIQSLCYSTRVC